MPYAGPLRFRVNGRSAGTWTLPCDGGVTTVTALVDMKVGWTAAEVGPPAATATLELQLSDDDLSADVYAVETITVAPTDPPAAAPGGPFAVLPVAVWTGYQRPFPIFCARFGCVLCARDSAGAIGSHGASMETFKGRMVLTGAGGATGSGRTAEEVTVRCDAKAVPPPAYRAAAASEPESVLVAGRDPQATADLAALVDRIVTVRLAEAFGRHVAVFVEPGEPPPDEELETASPS